MIDLGLGFGLDSVTIMGQWYDYGLSSGLGGCQSFFIYFSFFVSSPNVPECLCMHVLCFHFLYFVSVFSLYIFVFSPSRFLCFYFCIPTTFLHVSSAGLSTCIVCTSD